MYFPYLVGYSAIMGFSIFLVLPLAAFMKVSGKPLLFLNSFSIGILVYLLMDIFMGTYISINPQFEDGVFNLPYSILMVIVILLSYAAFSLLPALIRTGNRTAENLGGGLPFMMAFGIGMQNLTEGLALGSTINLGLSSLVAPIIIGFTIQNLTEGFPIVAPFLGSGGKVPFRKISLALFIGGFPTLVGSVLSISITSLAFIVSFNAIAIGSILFVALQLYRMNSRSGSSVSFRYGDAGLMVGFLLAFAVNLLP